MHIYNGFTWLLISLSCDFNLVKDGSVRDSFMAIGEDEQLRKKKERTKRIVNFMKRITVHGILLVMLLLSLFGTLYHKSGEDGWCNVVTVAVVISSFLPLVVFGVAVFFHA